MKPEDLSREQLIERIRELEVSLSRGPASLPPMVREGYPTAALFELIYESLADGVVGFDSQGKILFANPGMGMLVGDNIENLIGKTPMEAWDEEFHDPYTRGQSTTFELRILRKDGSRRAVMKKIFGLTSDPPLDIAIYRDVTRLERAEKAAREQKEFFRAIVEHAHELVLVIDRAGVVRYTSPSMRSMLGYKESSILSTPLQRILAPESREVFFAFKAQLQKGEKDVLAVDELHFINRGGGRVRFTGSIRGCLGVPMVDGFVLNLVDVTEHRELAERVKHEQMLLEGILKTSITGMLMTDADSVVVFANAAAGKILGHKEGDLYGKRPTEFGFMYYDLDGVDIEDENLPFHRVLKNSETVQDAYFGVIRGDGTIQYVSISGTPLYTPDGDLEGAVFLVNDVSSTIENQVRIRLAERVTDSVSNGILAVDSRSKGMNVVFVNSAFEKITGFTRQEVMGQSCLVSEEVPPSRHALMAICSAVGKLRSGHMMIRTYRKDLRPLWLELSIAPVFSQSGQVTHIVGVVNDVTRRQEAVMSMQETQNLLTSLIQAMPLGLAVTDNEGRYVLVNNRLCEMMGYEEEELKGRCFDFVVPEEAREAALEAHNRYLEEGLEIPDVWPIVRKDGTRFNGRIYSARIIREAKSNLKITIVEDLTEREQTAEEQRQLEAEVRYAQKLESLGVLAGGIAHDFNNLLVGVLGSVGLAISEVEQASAAYPFLEQIEETARRMSKLTGQLLSFAGEGEFKLKELALNDLVRDSRDLAGFTISKRIDVTYELCAGNPKVQADADQLRQVLLNLLSNASEAIGNGDGTITVSTGSRSLDADEAADIVWCGDITEGDYAYIRVADSGCGMDQETIEKIFDPFFTTKRIGRGLGLAVVQGIIRALKGALLLESEEGKGTAVTILLPMAVTEVEDVQDEATESSPWKSVGRILVADDEDTVRKVILETLHRAGFNVVLAADGAQALDIYRKYDGEFDLAILDVTMPGLSGWEVYTEMRALHEEVRIIMISGYGTARAEEFSSLHGISRFLHKPFSRHELLQAVREILSN